ncbi:MAG: hypothetical protein LBD14_02395, partial [Puniceicoccales bacterium]|nr:hypothetical protein [Puniceicoccales bacterium]
KGERKQFFQKKDAGVRLRAWQIAGIDRPCLEGANRAPAIRPPAPKRAIKYLHTQTPASLLDFLAMPISQHV